MLLSEVSRGHSRKGTSCSKGINGQRTHRQAEGLNVRIGEWSIQVLSVGVYQPNHVRELLI